VLEPQRAGFVGLDGEIVGFAIHLDGEPRKEADEIDDVVADGIVMAKPQRAGSSGAELLPETLFGRGQVATQEGDVWRGRSYVFEIERTPPLPLPTREGGESII
jgi:hypothetical protein